MPFVRRRCWLRGALDFKVDHRIIITQYSSLPLCRWFIIYAWVVLRFPHPLRREPRAPTYYLFAFYITNNNKFKKRLALIYVAVVLACAENLLVTGWSRNLLQFPPPLATVPSIEHPVDWQLYYCVDMYGEVYNNESEDAKSVAAARRVWYMLWRGKLSRLPWFQLDCGQLWALGKF